ncbi:HAD family hydrolase [Mucilaginibacter phyllosphaerae]|uniref:Beta-phosphoglucomutase family hydrolase n=1 Tax=Mucilaginibacter phyllosphaerae TaxID=1812349 RepID=A0A4Y8AJB2_9SPHI|nr:HAD family phosphatase [Mucilaginibacter phyllosphaerae]MBB3968274.1 beta-phosphoglucomutase family hydrolase [Mucilaginibacter phyllosphaerae]TEW68722.1 HAD family phosphatase [Mucilaginibacter phyllosphaerae]GGH00026.1 beta-phosphoglucomutase [Mucilaginibacter phyllosphaerae]
MKALIFDLNGTMIDDMLYHTNAWKDIMNNQLGGNFTFEQVKQNMYGKNSEVLIRMFGEGYFTDEQITELSFEKERLYQQAFLPELKLLPGLTGFIEKAYRNNIPMAIASAAIPFNIDFVLDNLNIRKYFSAIVSADHVKISKPHPETFLKAAGLLGVSSADCLVFEDVPKGAEAAFNAQMQCVILTTTHQPDEFAHLPNILNFSSDYTSAYLQGLLK